MTTNQKGLKRLSVILVVAMLLSLIPATLGFAAEVDTAKVEAFVSRLYVAALDRQPDAGGLKYWTNQLASKNQTAAQGISFILIESKEFQAKGLTDSAFLDTVYKAFFDRAADASGKAFWTLKLEQGYSRRWVIQQMVGAMTGEFQRLCEEAGIVPGKVGGVTSRDLPMTVTKVAAINDKTVVATLSKDVATVVAGNFSISLKSDEYALSVIDSASIKDGVVTIKLVDTLVDDEEYVLSINNLAAKDGSVTNALAVGFKYTKQKAVSIAVKNTTIQTGKELEYIIKDAAGNDITDNYASEDIELESSNSAIVDPDDFLVALDGDKDPSYAIVNFILTVDEDTQIESGNTIVTVRENLQTLTSIGRWTLTKDGTGTLAKPVTSLAKSAVGYSMLTEALDQDGKAIEDAVITYKSMTPTILVVDVDGTVNEPAAVGSATVLITAKYAGKTVNKTVAVTVKASPVATSLKVSATSVKLVKGSDIEKDIDVEVLDQYNDVIDVAGDLTYKMSVADIYDAGTSVQPAALVGGKATITLEPGTAIKTGTLTITAKVGTKTFTKTVSVSLVEAGRLSSYVAEAGASKLDLHPDEDETYGPTSTDVRVFAKDVNGNYISELTEGEQFTLVPAVEDQEIVTIDGATVTANEVGTVKVIVYVGSAKGQTLTFTVVDSAAVLTTVKQVKTVVDVVDGGDLIGVLFGNVEGEVDGAFIGYDQYGEKVQIDEYQVLTSNKAIVDSELNALDEGTATLTILLNDKIYVITVIVK